MNQDQDTAGQQSGYEKRDVNVRAVGVVTIVSVLVIAILVVALYDYFVATKEEIIHEQVLTSESEELLMLRAEEEEALSSYRLLDSTAAVYQIPIEQAMELMVREAEGTAGSQ